MDYCPSDSIIYIRIKHERLAPVARISHDHKEIKLSRISAEGGSGTVLCQLHKTSFLLIKPCHVSDNERRIDVSTKPSRTFGFDKGAYQELTKTFVLKNAAAGHCVIRVLFSSLESGLGIFSAVTQNSACNLFAIW